MLTRSLTTTLLQIFFELLLYSQVISESMKVADNIFKRNSEYEWVKIGLYISNSLVNISKYPYVIPPFLILMKSLRHKQVWENI